MATVPAIDGTLSGGEWPGTPVEMKQTPGRQPISGAAAKAWVGHDDTTLYVAMSMPIRDPAKVNREGKQGVADEAEVVFRDASGAKPGPTFSVIGMAGGKHEVSTFTDAPGWMNDALNQRTKFAAKIEGDRWTGEWAIPLEAAGIKVRPGLKLGFNLGSYRSESNEWIIWIGALASTLELDGGGFLILD